MSLIPALVLELLKFFLGRGGAKRLPQWWYRVNILHFLANRASEPLVRSKMAITLEFKLYQSNFSRENTNTKEGYQRTYITIIFTRPVDSYSIPYF